MKKYKEFEDVEEKDRQRKKHSPSIKNVLDGSILTSDIVLNQFSFILFLVMLAMIYISSSYNSQRIMKNIYEKETQLKELRHEASTMASELMSKTRRTAVIEQLQKRDIELEASNEPIKKIIINKH